MQAIPGRSDTNRTVGGESHASLPGQHRGCVRRPDLGAQTFQCPAFRRGNGRPWDGVTLHPAVSHHTLGLLVLSSHVTGQPLALFHVPEQLAHQHAAGLRPHLCGLRLHPGPLHPAKQWHGGAGRDTVQRVWAAGQRFSGGRRLFVHRQISLMCVFQFSAPFGCGFRTAVCRRLRLESGCFAASLAQDCRYPIMQATVILACRLV